MARQTLAAQLAAANTKIAALRAEIVNRSAYEAALRSQLSQAKADVEALRTPRQAPPYVAEHEERRTAMAAAKAEAVRTGSTVHV